MTHKKIVRELENDGFQGIDTDRPVLVVGAAGIDMVGRLKSDLQPETSNQSNIRTSFGGVARNVAENLARLGHPTTLLTVVGDDYQGRSLVDEAASAGVNVEHVLFTNEHPTSTYMGVINSAGRLEFAVDDMRAMSELSSEYLRSKAALFKEASMVFVDGNVPRNALRSLFSMARRARRPVCADPTTASLAHRFESYLDQIYLMTPNSAEASVYCGGAIQPSERRQVLESAKNLVARGVKIAIISLAEHGVCYATSQTSGFIPALRTEIIDPTGAGDALTATAIFALLNGIPLDDTVRLAVSAATLTLGYRGAVVPDLSLEKLYDRLVI